MLCIFQEHHFDFQHVTFEMPIKFKVEMIREINLGRDFKKYFTAIHSLKLNEVRVGKGE